MPDKLNITLNENINGMVLKCPKCEKTFNPGAISLIMAFENIDNGSTVRAPPYKCVKCGEPSSVSDWYKSTLATRS